MMILLVLWLAWQTSKVIAELPSLSTEANSSYLTTGDTVVIKCRVTNTSLLSIVNEYSIHWWKDGVKLTESSMMLSQDVKDTRYSVRLDAERNTVFSMLQIINITNEDEGTFVCELKGSEISKQNQPVIIKVNNLLGTLEDHNNIMTTQINLNNSSLANVTEEFTQSSDDNSQSLPNTTTSLISWNTMTMTDDTTLADRTTASTGEHTQRSEETTTFHLTAKALDTSTFYEENTTVNDNNNSQTSESSRELMIALTAGGVMFLILIIVAGITCEMRKRFHQLHDYNFIKRKPKKNGHQFELRETQNRQASYEDANETNSLRTFKIARPMVRTSVSSASYQDAYSNDSNDRMINTVASENQRNSVPSGHYDKTSRHMINSESSGSYDRSCSNDRMLNNGSREQLHCGHSVDANEFPSILTENSQCMHSSSNLIESEDLSFESTETNPKTKRKHGYESWQNCHGHSVDINEPPSILTENNECFHSSSNLIDSEDLSFGGTGTNPKNKRKHGYESWQNVFKEYNLENGEEPSKCPRNGQN